MILITVGTEKYPFDRLMTWLDTLSASGFLAIDQEEVIVQYGSCKVLPAGVKVYSMLPESKFKTLMETARVIISHCGEGSVNVLGEMGKPYILVPRASRFGEHVDDHQIELAEALEQTGTPIAWSPGDLARFLVAPWETPMSGMADTILAKLCQQLQQRLGL